jgi:hypothetical protein
MTKDRIGRVSDLGRASVPYRMNFELCSRLGLDMSMLVFLYHDGAKG